MLTRLLLASTRARLYHGHVDSSYPGLAVHTKANGGVPCLILLSHWPVFIAFDETETARFPELLLAKTLLRLSLNWSCQRSR